MNWRGSYEGGGMVVTAKHWWSPTARKGARLAAGVLEHEASKLGPGAVISYPYEYFKINWTSRDRRTGPAGP